MSCNEEGPDITVRKTRPMIAASLADELDAAEWERSQLERLSRGTLIRLHKRVLGEYTDMVTLED